MNRAEFELLLADPTKRVIGDILWNADEDHSPTVEFRVEVDSSTDYPLWVKGSYNALAQTLTYTLVHHAVGRIYGLDLGKDHRNPDGQYVGEKHKHHWTDQFRDQEHVCPSRHTCSCE